MKKRMRFLRRDLLGKVATVTLGAAALAGCSSATERFGPDPYYTASTKNQREIMNGSAPAQPSYQDIVNGPGGTVAGLPQSASAPVSTGSIPKQPQPVYTPPQPAPVTTPVIASVPKPPRVATPKITSRVTPQSLPAGESWKGWTAEGGTRVSARQGDTLASMSRRYGVPLQAVASVNGLKKTSSIRPGQSVIIPTYVYADHYGKTRAAKTDKVKLPPAANRETLVTGSIPTIARSTPRPDRKPYEQPTFAQISQKAPPATIAATTPASTLPKRKPGEASRPIVTASVPQAAISKSVPEPRRQPVRHISTSPKQPAEVKTPVVSVPGPQSDAPPKTEAAPEKPIEVAAVEPKADQSTAKFRWPVRGRIISDFGAKPGGGRNEGVNLAVPEGTPVKAAGDGTVIYSGNELKGYGNLVLVRHDEGYVSAYAHNSVLNVKRGDKVRRGDAVALAGATGSVNQPQVHFELRKGNKPVDPLKFLPRR